MFIPKVVSEGSRKSIDQNHVAQISSYEKLERDGALIAYSDKAASWAQLVGRSEMCGLNDLDHPVACRMA